MKTKEYKTIDKSEWDRGEWDHEPDKMQWQDEATGLPCLIVRGPAGALCGYVGITEEHPMFELSYEKPDVSVHWGLTYANFCAETKDESRHICHLPEEGEPDRVWWFGFDCAHSGDYCPGHSKHFRQRDPTLFRMGEYERYRNVGFVKHECAELARQLKGMVR